MLTRLRLPVLLLLTLLAGHLPAATPQPLVLGVLPFQSPVALFRQFAPLRDYLTTQLGRPVELETASNYAAFVERTGQRRYDLVFTAPHFTLLALDSGHYTLSATLTNPLRGVIVVPTDSPLQSLRELAGCSIATPPARAIISRVTRRYLAAAGLAGSDMPRYQVFNSHAASLLAAAAGQTEAAIASANVYRRRPANLRLLASTPPLPSMGFLSAADLPQSLQRRVKQVLISMADSKPGREVLQHIGYPGFRQIRAIEYEALREYLPPAAGGDQ